MKTAARFTGSAMLHFLLSVSMTSCATMMVRTSKGGPQQAVYPATTLDAGIFWRTGMKGEPLFTMADPDYRERPSTRLLCCTATGIDFPFSIVSDTLLLPWDLAKSSREPAEESPPPDSAAAH